MKDMAHIKCHIFLIRALLSFWIATILSAQCTDARVNMVTPHLFAKYRDVHAFAIADRNELEKDIHSIGFYHNKDQKYNCMRKDA